MKDKPKHIKEIAKSSFIRSVFTRVLSIFIVVSLIIAAVAFFSFTSEISRSVLKDKAKQMEGVERTISQRMSELQSIAFRIGNDQAFYLKPVTGDASSGREMSAMLERYLVGNSFIEHLAFCRTAEPDTIYTSRGERSLSEFFTTGLRMDQATAAWITESIYANNKTRVGPMGEGDAAYFTYDYPLPQLADKPQAHVLMMIPMKPVRTLLETLLIDGNGRAAVYGADGALLFAAGSPEDDIDLGGFAAGADREGEYRSPAGVRYRLQKATSDTNGWTYVTALRSGDTLTGLAGKQIAFIIFVLVALVGAVLLMLAIVASRYRPISRLAAQVAKDGGEKTVVDEHALLSDTIAALRDDSEQKQKYETAYREAEAASKAKSAFLSSMSHDIRTPMNAIIGMTAIARKHIGDQQYVDDCLKKVQAASDYLLSIINNVLDMSRIESARIPIVEEPLMIPALMDSVISLMTSAAEAKSQTITADTREVRQNAVVGDGIHIVQVFVNILSNAVKFTPEGGRIAITVRQTESGDGYGDYAFAFADTGIGIPPDFIDKVFDTFSRAEEPRAERIEGTGLGMAIAKKLVELMGGTIACESELGRGSTFTVSLRMKYAEQTPDMIKDGAGVGKRADGDGCEAIDLTGKRILLVEDNAMNREIARKIIGETGAAITEANNGKEAVETFAASPEGYFDLIFMDIQMPVMNGYEATAAIRRMDRADAAAVAIYAMTANTFDEDVRQVRDAGMNGHIGKPYHPATLYRTLRHAFSAPGDGVRRASFL